MYDVNVEGPDLSVLLVHRAVLFGLLVAALIGAIVSDDARRYVIGGVLVSDVASWRSQASTRASTTQ